MTDVNEADVEAAFVRYLLERGWDVDIDKVDHADVVARRGAEHLVAEVKGTTAAAGLDVDTAYGQLLRRMGDRPEGTRTHHVGRRRRHEEALLEPAPLTFPGCGHQVVVLQRAQVVVHLLPCDPHPRGERRRRRRFGQFGK